MVQTKVRIGILIFFLALAVRVVYLDQLKDAFLFYHPIVDSGAYEQNGAKAATSGDESGFAFQREPFYCAFLALIYKTCGRNIYFACLVQSVMGSLGAVFVYFIGKSIFSRKVGITSGVLASLYWPLIAFEAKFLPVNLAIFFSLISVVSLCLFLEKKNIFWIFSGGITLALSTLSRANILLLFPVLIFWFLLRFAKTDGFRKAVLYCAIFIFGFSLIISPVLIKLYTVKKEIIPVQDNYGVGIYFGSDLELINIRPGCEWRKLMMELLDKGLTRPGERNLYFLAKTKELILKRPFYFLANLLKKVYILCNYYEFSPRENINYFREKSSFLSLPFFNFGSIAALAILGMIFAWRHRDKAAPLYLFVFTYQVSLLPFMPLARYRLPLAPFLIIFASFGAVRCLGYFKEGRTGEILQCAVFLTIFFILTNTNVMLGYLEGFNRPHYHEGLAYYQHTNDSHMALQEFQKALMKHPRDPDIFEAMGDVYLAMGDLNRAEVSYKKALKLENRFPEVMNNLGVIYAKRGEFEKAKDIFKKVLSSFPVESVKARINLGSVFMAEADYEKAVEEYKRALFLEPDNLQALYRLASLYDAMKNPEAISLWRKYNTNTAAQKVDKQ